jgi:hypothetical protein
LPTRGIIRTIRLLVWSNWAAFSISVDEELVPTRTALDECCTHGGGAPLTESLVVAVGAFAIGMSLDDDSLLSGLDPLRDFRQSIIGFRANIGTVEVEQKVRPHAQALFALRLNHLNGLEFWLEWRRRRNGLFCRGRRRYRRGLPGQFASLALGSAVPPISTQKLPFSSPSTISRITWRPELSIAKLLAPSSSVPKPARTKVES